MYRYFFRTNFENLTLWISWKTRFRKIKVIFQGEILHNYGSLGKLPEGVYALFRKYITFCLK